MFAKKAITNLGDVKMLYITAHPSINDICSNGHPFFTLNQKWSHELNVQQVIITKT